MKNTLTHNLVFVVFLIFYFFFLFFPHSSFLVYYCCFSWTYVFSVVNIDAVQASVCIVCTVCCSFCLLCAPRILSLFLSFYLPLSLSSSLSRTHTHADSLWSMIPFLPGNHIITNIFYTHSNRFFVCIWHLMIVRALPLFACVRARAWVLPCRALVPATDNRVHNIEYEKN